MTRAVLSARLRRWLAATPAAFRQDPVFRFAAIGAVLAFLMLLGRMGPHGANPVPPPPAPTGPQAPLAGQGGADAAGGGPQAPAAVSGPIAPSRSLNGLTITPDSNAPVDRFGTVEAARPRKKER